MKPFCLSAITKEKKKERENENTKTRALQENRNKRHDGVSAV